MNLDFLEIGTADFDTCIQCYPDDAIGISVEPIKYYLDKLPNKPFVKKINAAVSLDDMEGTVDVYYIPTSVIVENGLEDWYRGCNSVGDYHYAHKQNNLTHLVVKEPVAAIPIGKILEDNNVVKIKYLKVDTEGADCFILNNLLNYLKDKERHYYPECVMFESNLLSDRDYIRETVMRWKLAGYDIIPFNLNNTLLIKK